MGEAATGRWQAGGRPEGGRANRRARGVLRRAARLTVASGLVVLAGPTLAPAAQAAPQISVSGLPPAVTHAAATTLAPADSHSGVEVTLTTVTPAVPTANGDVTLTGTVRNRTGSAVQGLHVGLRTTGRPLGQRSDIESLASSGGQAVPNLDGYEITDDPSLQQHIGTLAAGASASFSIKAPISKLHLGPSPDGVYSLGVDAVSSVTGESLGIARTFLPLHAKDSAAKATKVATLWPLTNPPVLQAQTYVDPSTHNEQPVLTQELASSLGQEGRLGQLTQLGQQNPDLHLTWMIDPDLIDTVNAMTGPYQVATASDITGANGCQCLTPGTGKQAATSWLSGLQSTLSAGKADVVSLPYADPDLASLAHDSSARAQVNSLLPVVGSSVGLDRLQIDAAHDVAWPYQGYVDSSIASLAKSMGASQIIVNGASMPDTSNLTFTPNAARRIGNGMTAVVADSELGKIFAGDLSTQAAQTTAVQLFLAETLAISGEQPSVQRDIVVQPPRNLSAATAQTLVRALKSAEGGAWVQPTDLNGVVQAGATAGANTHVPSDGSYPSSVRGGELSAYNVTNIQRTQQDLTQLQRILTRPERLREPFNAAMVRSVSTGWRADPQAGTTYTGDMYGYMDGLQGSVHILKKTSDVVVPGDNASAQIAVSVENNLEQNVTRLKLYLEVDGTSYPRLKIDSPSATDGVDISIAGGGTKVTSRFKVTATANGQVTMRAVLRSAQDGSEISSESFTVTVTSVSSGVIAVMASGGLLVVLAGLRLYWKRKKNAALAAATADGPEDPTASEDQEADA
ncbi:DUF6049 family protein [Streptacidiphilus jiangxiensis]|uniref:Uncharacterized protein n=1 Tax=Streptacidiphilus jiangxiensis TaxID=235985 RepID=A0A1H7JCX6_STRJI|nr:DUF6049 family protein [Streptacidiphilus jiangxiensis]SEK71820.1 hypothetical protein SAMN05414137_103216 [Streptacidiphilus jiangxiensis]